MMFGKLLFILLVLAVVGGFVFAMFWDMPAPSQQVEKTIVIETK